MCHFSEDHHRVSTRNHAMMPKRLGCAKRVGLHKKPAKRAREKAGAGYAGRRGQPGDDFLLADRSVSVEAPVRLSTTLRSIVCNSGVSVEIEGGWAAITVTHPPVVRVCLSHPPVLATKTDCGGFCSRGTLTTLPSFQCVCSQRCAWSRNKFILEKGTSRLSGGFSSPEAVQ
jgi:hypothetical protein